jgi:carboxypeptidase Taq
MIHASYTALIDHMRQIALLSSTQSLLGWDQETMMPTGGDAVPWRGRQMAQIARLAHQMQTDEKVAAWLTACEADRELMADPLSPPAVNVREIRRAYDRATKLPGELVAEFVQTTSQAKHVWSQAKTADDYRLFEPLLARLIDLNRQRAACWGWAECGEAWDALADGFEPGMTAAQVERVFAPLRTDLVALVQELLDTGRTPGDRFSHLELPLEKQRSFCRQIAGEIGFDFARGRLDESAHPFCGGTHRDDVRMTTHYVLHDLPDALFSTLHEAGHGMYEQNLPGGEHVGMPMGEAVSLSIHESQSRLIENFVGRSRAFWTWCLPKLHAHFGAPATELSLDEAVGGVNIVRRSLIRTAADEATYNLHIMVRFELERAMLRGDLSAADLPGAWNEKYKAYLDLDVPSDRQGCLQDIHWSMGAMGYFPTYTLGNLYAAQFFEAAAAELGDIHAMVARGEFAPLIGWLTRNIHSQGMRYRSAELCEVVTGKPVSAAPLLRHLSGKFRPLYGLD